jgi:hypothetical protein
MAVRVNGTFGDYCIPEWGITDGYPVSGWVVCQHADNGYNKVAVMCDHLNCRVFAGSQQRRQEEHEQEERMREHRRKEERLLQAERLQYARPEVRSNIVRSKIGDLETQKAKVREEIERLTKLLQKRVAQEKPEKDILWCRERIAAETAKLVPLNEQIGQLIIGYVDTCPYCCYTLPSVHYNTHVKNAESFDVPEADWWFGGCKGRAHAALWKAEARADWTAAAAAAAPIS